MKPIQLIVFDILGSLASIFKGAQYLVVATVHFPILSRTIWTAKLPITTIATIFLENYVSNFAVGTEVLNDIGAHFSCHFFALYCALLILKAIGTLNNIPEQMDSSNLSIKESSLLRNCTRQESKETFTNLFCLLLMCLTTISSKEKILQTLSSFSLRKHGGLPDTPTYGVEDIKH